MINANFVAIFSMPTQVVTTQVNQGAVAPLNVVSMATIVTDFTRINPLKFHRSKVDEDPKNLLMKYTGLCPL